MSLSGKTIICVSTVKCNKWYTEGTWWRHQWKHFPRYWPFVRGIHRSPVNSPHKGQWRGALMFSLICARINDWVNNREAGDLRRHRGHYDVIVMKTVNQYTLLSITGDSTPILTFNTPSEWVVKFNGLLGDSGQRGQGSPYKPCNRSLYIGINIYPHIDNTICWS